MSNILVDLYKVKNYFSGLGQFSANFAKELVNQAPSDWNIDFLVPPKNAIVLPDGNYNLIKTNYQHRYLPFLNKNYDLWHSLNQFPSHSPSSESTQILTVHDLNFLIEKNETKSLKYLKALAQNVERAEYITTISEFSKGELVRHLDLAEKDVSVIYNGVSFGDPGSQKPSFIKNDNFFFSIGIFNKKKNFHTLISLMEKFEDFHLILAGDHDNTYGIEIKNEINKRGLSQRCILSGKISEHDKNWLYANARALLFPSIAEGFGLPVIEAMYHGTPVFVSKETSLPEIGGDLAYYFNDFDSASMAEVIQNGLDDFDRNAGSLMAKLKKHALQFTWEKSMVSYVELYKKVLQSG